MDVIMTIAAIAAGGIGSFVLITFLQCEFGI